MRGYISALSRAIFRHGRLWWGSFLALSATYLFGAGFWSEYPAARDSINWALGTKLMPDQLPFLLIPVAFLLWLVGSFAHEAAMRRVNAAVVHFSLRDPSFFALHNKDAGVQIPDSEMCAVKVDISNNPRSMVDGQDIEAAWSEIELFDLKWNKVTQWKYGRWEENKNPGYDGNPRDYYPDDQNVRRLVANGRPSILCIAHKQLGGEFAYPLRGEDQLKPLWRDDNFKIAQGTYFVRLTLRGKGLERPASTLYELRHSGAGSELYLEKTATSELLEKKYCI